MGAPLLCSIFLTVWRPSSPATTQFAAFKLKLFFHRGVWSVNSSSGFILHKYWNVQIFTRVEKNKEGIFERQKGETEKGKGKSVKDRDDGNTWYDLQALACGGLHDDAERPAGNVHGWVEEEALLFSAALPRAWDEGDEREKRKEKRIDRFLKRCWLKLDGKAWLAWTYVGFHLSKRRRIPTMGANADRMLSFLGSQSQLQQTYHRDGRSGWALAWAEQRASPRRRDAQRNVALLG